jgi:nuclear protein, 1
VSSNKRCGGGGTKVLVARTAAQPPQLINTTGSPAVVRSEPRAQSQTPHRETSAAEMSENNVDAYEHYNYEFEKHVHSGHSGKQRSKKEASEHTNHFDPSGHSRKIVTKLQNTENNQKSKAVEQQAGGKAKQ